MDIRIVQLHLSLMQRACKYCNNKNFFITSLLSVNGIKTVIACSNKFCGKEFNFAEQNIPIPDNFPVETKLPSTQPQPVQQQPNVVETPEQKLYKDFLLFKQFQFLHGRQ